MYDEEVERSDWVRFQQEARGTGRIEMPLYVAAEAGESLDPT